MQIWIIAVCVVILAIIMAISVAFMTHAVSWALYLLVAAAIIAVALGAATPFITSVKQDIGEIRRRAANSIDSVQQQAKSAYSSVDNALDGVTNAVNKVSNLGALKA